MKLMTILFIFVALPASGQVKENLQRYSPHQVLDAIIYVESREIPTAYNRDEPEAVGILQQFPVYVRDVNRISGRKYKLSDRRNPIKAVEMFWIYQGYYNPSGDVEKMIRIHSGGPDGWKEDCTLDYLQLVKNRLYETR